MNGVCEDCDYVQVVTTVWDIPDFVIEIEADRDASLYYGVLYDYANKSII